MKVIEARLKQQAAAIPRTAVVHSEEPSSAAEVSSDVLSSSVAATARSAAAMDNSGSLGRPPAKLVRLKSPRYADCCWFWFRYLGHGNLE